MFVGVDDLISDDSAIVEENLVIVLAKRESHHPRVTLDVVKFVHVN